MDFLVKAQTYARKDESEGTETQVQIVVTKNAPIREILTGFYSTVVVNFFTYNKAYSLSSKPTFLHKKWVHERPSDWDGKPYD